MKRKWEPIKFYLKTDQYQVGCTIKIMKKYTFSKNKLYKYYINVMCVHNILHCNKMKYSVYKIRLL